MGTVVGRTVLWKVVAGHARPDLRLFVNVRRLDPVARAWLTTVAIAVCGNGVIEGTEVCDDNNTVGGDGCRSDCTVESGAGWTCSTASPSVCQRNDASWDVQLSL